VILLADTARHDIANYVSGLFTVYIVLLFIYILLNIAFTFGVRPPYSRVSDAILGFLRDVSEPYLRVFRRFIPPMGQIDLSPLLAIIVLYVVRLLLVSAIGLGAPAASLAISAAHNSQAGSIHTLWGYGRRRPH